MFARSAYAYAHEIRCKGTKKNAVAQIFELKKFRSF